MEPKSFQQASETNKNKKCENRTVASTGVIWKPNAIKNRFQIEVQIKIDFEVDFGAKMETTSSPKGGKMEAKSEKIQSKIEV